MYVMARAWTQNKPRATYELGQKEYEILESQERHKVIFLTNYDIGSCQKDLLLW